MTRKTRVVVGTILTLAAIAGVSYQALRPKWVTATREEVDRVIDPILLKKEPPDPAAEKRYVRFAALVKNLKYTSVPYVPGHKATPQEVTDTAHKFRTNNVEFVKGIRQVLSEGAFRRPVRNLASFEYPWGAEKGLAKGLQLVISDKTAPAETRIEAIQLGELLTWREFEGSRSIIDYLVAVAIASIIETPTRKFLADESIPLATAKKLLASLPNIDEDTDLAKVIVGDFQTGIYPYLPDPEKYGKELANEVSFAPISEDKEDSDLPGCYNALWAAKEFSDLAMEELKNAERPLRDITSPVADRLEKNSAALPEDKSEGKEGFERWWAKKSYRIRMNLIPNSFAYYIAPFSGIRTVVRTRDEVRTQHRLLRLQIACAVYAGEKGAFPKKLSDLVTARLVDSVPQDPFGTGPMHYDPARKIIWSNGYNFSDDHGSELKGTMSRPADFVVHLRAAKNP